MIDEWLHGPFGFFLVGSFMRFFVILFGGVELIEDFESDLKGFNFMSEFEESLMYFSFEVHLDSFVGVADGLDGSADKTDLLLLLHGHHIVSHEFDFLAPIPESIDLFQTSGAFIDPTTLAELLGLRGHFFDVLVDSDESVEDLFGPFCGVRTLVVDHLLILPDLLLHIHQSLLDPI